MTCRISSCGSKQCAAARAFDIMHLFPARSVCKNRHRAPNSSFCNNAWTIEAAHILTVKSLFLLQRRIQIIYDKLSRQQHNYQVSVDAVDIIVNGVLDGKEAEVFSKTH